MTGIAIPGLGSGLDTSSMVTQLMAVEAQPQTILKNRVTTQQSAVTALQSVNTKALALKAAAQKLYQPATPDVMSKDATNTTWKAVKATSSSDSVTTSTIPPAQAGTLRFNVTSLADSFYVATAAVAANTPITGEPPTLQFTLADGTTATVNPSSSSIASVVAAINSANLGIHAATIGQADGTMRLQLSSAKTGSEQSFSVQGLTVATPITHQGHDAVLDFGDGLTASSSSNTFKDLMPGTSVTVSKLENDVTISTAQDTDGMVSDVKGMVDSLNSLLSEIKTKSAWTAPTGSGASGTSGPLTGDSTVRSLSMALQSAISSTGVSPADAGISIGSDGTYSFDQDKFSKLLASDPDKAQALTSAFAQRVGDIAAAATDKTSGSLTTAVTDRQSTIKDLNQQVDAWTDRLALRKEALQKQFSALDVAMQASNSTLSWLSGQLSSLSSSSSS